MRAVVEPPYWSARWFDLGIMSVLPTHLYKPFMRGVESWGVFSGCCFSLSGNLAEDISVQTDESCKLPVPNYRSTFSGTLKNESVGEGMGHHDKVPSPTLGSLARSVSQRVASALHSRIGRLCVAASPDLTPLGCFVLFLLGAPRVTLSEDHCSAASSV